MRSTCALLRHGIRNGDGLTLLRLGSASVRDENDDDLTAGMLKGARAMVAFAKEENIDCSLFSKFERR